MRRASDGVAYDFCAGASAAPPLVRLGPFRMGLDPLRTLTTVNARYADDRDNGAVWAGRGASMGVSAGLYVRMGPLSGGIAPIVALHQNAAFGLRAPLDPANGAWSSGLYADIDHPQRMGPDPFARLDLGQTYVRADLLRLTAGWSNENLWIGPATRYPILMSNTAGGFPHAFAGTSRPLDLWLFRIDGEVVLGDVRESRWFDARPGNDERRLSLWSLSIAPRFLPDLDVGVARAYMFDPDTGDVSLFDLFSTGHATNLEGNELASMFARWVIPASATELYGEYARDDGYATIEDDLITEIDHSQAYMLGFQQIGELGGRRVRVQVEIAHLQEQQELRPGRPLPIYYLHGGMRQGYTHGGQLLGASIGPGADAQFLALDILGDACLCGIFVERVRRNAASGPALAARAMHPYALDTELTAGARGSGWWRGMLVGGTMSFSRRWNRDYLKNDWNLKLVADVRWHPLASAD